MFMKKYFPLFIDISRKRILVVGGGEIAYRRIKSLAGFSPFIRVVTKQADEKLKQLSYNRLEIFERALNKRDLENIDFILAATDNVKYNKYIGYEARKRNIAFNDCSDKTNCDFYFPGLVCKDELVIGVCASGMNHRLAAGAAEYIRKNIEAIFSKGKKNV